MGRRSSSSKLVYCQKPRRICGVKEKGKTGREIGDVDGKGRGNGENKAKRERHKPKHNTHTHTLNTSHGTSTMESRTHTHTLSLSLYSYLISLISGLFFFSYSVFSPWLIGG